MKKQVFIGIDVSKETLDVVLLCAAESKNASHQRFKNNKTGFRSMLSWVKSQYSMSDCLFCLEDTGLYSYGVCYHLSAQQLDYVVESAYRIKHSLGIVRGKTDKADALLIAQYAHRFADQLPLKKLPSSQVMELKLLLTHRCRLLKQKSRFATSLSETKLLASLIDVSFITASLQTQIKALKEQIKKVNAQIKTLLQSEESLQHQHQLLCSVPGVGLLVSAHVLAYSEGFTRFPTWRKFACYIGSAPFPKQSGTSIRGKTKTCSIANKRLKALMSMAAVNMLRLDTEYRRYYQRKLGQGKHHMVILNAIRNKLISRMFAVIQRDTPYVALPHR